MHKYIIVFITFSIIGWLYEYLITGKRQCFSLLKERFNICLPVLPIYGVGGIILLYIHLNYKDLSFIQRVLIASILINIIECLSGLLSLQINGHKTWNYYHHGISYCKGYISLITIIWWTFLITIFYGLLEFKLKLKK